MDWAEVSKRIATLAEEIQKTALVLEDKRKELAPIEEELVRLEKELSLLAAEKDEPLRKALEAKYKKITEKMLDRALLMDYAYKRLYDEYCDYKAKKVKLECEIKSLEGRLKAIALLLRLAELDATYFFKMGIIDRHQDFDEHKKVTL